MPARFRAWCRAALSCSRKSRRIHQIEAEVCFPDFIVIFFSGLVPVTGALKRNHVVGQLPACPCRESAATCCQKPVRRRQNRKPALRTRCLLEAFTFRMKFDLLKSWGYSNKASKAWYLVCTSSTPFSIPEWSCALPAASRDLAASTSAAAAF
jgi:hypothetical protein